jgi:hypothetical protein
MEELRKAARIMKRGYVVTLQNFDKLIKQGVKEGTIIISENQIDTENTFDI